jgi:hypothetical protein
MGCSHATHPDTGWLFDRQVTTGSGAQVTEQKMAARLFYQNLNMQNGIPLAAGLGVQILRLEIGRLGTMAVSIVLEYLKETVRQGNDWTPSGFKTPCNAKLGPAWLW